MLSASRVLITGGTGSFGRAMVHRLLAAGAQEIRVFSRDEAKQESMRHSVRDNRVRFYVGDVRDLDSLVKASKGIDFVFHAAALKQVPSCEFFPLEAVRTNVLGSVNVVEACERNGVRSLVVLSTDKAVYPVSAMGMTKGLMEKVARAHSRATPQAQTVVSCVRYGNVMYSRGSVIPLFVEQIKEGRPLTVTDPAMTRFLMSLDDSVSLVEHAFAHAQPGDVFLRKASACTIGNLAEAVCAVFEVPLKMDVTGIRLGEKMAETLASRHELAHAEDHGEFYRVPVDSRDLDYAIYGEESDPDSEYRDDFTSANAPRLSVSEIADLLLTVPQIRAELGAIALR